jgi:hypothetical protein
MMIIIEQRTITLAMSSSKGESKRKADACGAYSDKDTSGSSQKRLKVTEVSAVHKCDECGEIFKKTVYSCENGHLYCWSCYNKTAYCGNGDCDGDCDVITINRPFTRLLKTVEVSCPNDKCDKWIKHADYKEHVDECKFTPLPCPIDPKNCKWSMDGQSISEIEKHMLTHASSKLSVVMREPIGMQYPVPYFALEEISEKSTQYHIVPLTKSGAVVDHMLFRLQLHKDHFHTCALILPSEGGKRSDSKDLYCVSFNIDENICYYGVSRATCCKHVHYFEDNYYPLPMYTRYPEIAVLTVCQDILILQDERHYNILREIQHSDDHPKFPSGWSSEDHLMKVWKAYAPKVSPSPASGSSSIAGARCLCCLVKKESKDAEPMFAKAGYELCDLHLAKFSGDDRLGLIGTITAINALNSEENDQYGSVEDHDLTIRRASNFLTSLIRKNINKA